MELSITTSVQHLHRPHDPPGLLFSFQCFSLNKLEGVATEGKMIDRALELIENREFWAGVVFLMPNSSSSSSNDSLPPHVTYKIRMDIDDVTRTNKIKDRYR